MTKSKLSAVDLKRAVSQALVVVNKERDAKKAARARAVEKEAQASPSPMARALPRGDRVLVCRDKPETQTAAGLIIADAVKSKRQTGTVVRVGPGQLNDDGERVPIDLAPGDRVLLVGYAGLELNEAVTVSEKDEYVLLREEDVVATFAD